MKIKSSYKLIRTPDGWAGVAATKHGICRVALPKRSDFTTYGELEMGIADPSECVDSPALQEAGRLLRRYFAGEVVSFDIPLDMRDYTDFQQSVWKAAAKIPYGETRTYGWIAKMTGKPAASRAAGQALGANPFPVIIPCHRVVASSGAIGGFSGGAGMKKKLLDLESKNNSPQRAQRSRRKK